MRPRAALATRLSDDGLDELDAADIRLRVPRGFTHEMSRYVFEQADHGRAAYAGIRYASRLEDKPTNWAIFESNEPVDCEPAEIEPDDHISSGSSRTTASSSIDERGVVRDEGRCSVRRSALRAAGWTRFPT